MRVDDLEAVVVLDHMDQFLERGVQAGGRVVLICGLLQFMEFLRQIFELNFHALHLLLVGDVSPEFRSSGHLTLRSRLAGAADLVLHLSSD